jgi:hypothetical protein
MKKILFILLGLTLFAAVAMAQDGSVKGKLIDTSGKQPLSAATISIMNVKDSSLVSYTLSDKKGAFEIKNLAAGNYRILISFKGYQTWKKNFSITTDKKSIDFGNIQVDRDYKNLPGVIVTNEEPVKLVGDTVEYKADAFKTKPNAVAEDLLKKLPGVDVGADGSVKAQGETVQRILVDGKRFFGDDPKMATRNLPPDVIDKIQVFDDLSDQSKFTGFDDGNRVKTINIVTKKDKRKGEFGRGVAGAGTDGNHDESINLHHFDGNRQLSILGQANDINKQNFTQQDIAGSGNGGRGRGGLSASSGNTGPGITTTLAGGLNYRDQWGSKSDVYGSYFYNNLRVAINQNSQTQNITSPDSSNYNNKASSSASHTPNQRINFNLEQKFDSSNSLIARPNITFQNSSSQSNSTTNTTGGINKTPINNSVSHSSSTSNGYNISGANVQLRHKFAKPYRTVSLDLNFSASENDGSGYNYAVNSFFKPVTRVDTLNQYYTVSSGSFTFSPALSYTEPVGKNQIIELRYNFRYNSNHSVNNTYEMDQTNNKYSVFDSLYSNRYEYTAHSNALTVNYRLQKTKYNFSIGSGVQLSDYISDNTEKNVVVSHSYINLTPSMRFTYNFSKTKNLRVFYSGSTGQPSVNNLQPIKSINGLDTTIGNPGLKPQFTNSVRILYSSFDPVTQRVIFATINASALSNDIQNFVIQHANGSKTTTYTNLSGTYNLSGYFNYGLALKKPKSNLNFTTNAGYAQSQTLVATDDAVLSPKSNFTRNTTLGETIKWTTNFKDKFDMNLSAGTVYNIARNTLNPTQNANYFVHTIITDLTFYTKNGWILASDFTYTYSGNRPAGYNASVPLISPAIAKQFLKNKAGELRLSVFDLLNQNVSVSRTVTGNTIVDSKTNTLTRYAMLTFTYNLRNFAAGAQQRTPGMRGGMRPPGGGDRGFRRGSGEN